MGRTRIPAAALGALLWAAAGADAEPLRLSEAQLDGMSAGRAPAEAGAAAAGDLGIAYAAAWYAGGVPVTAPDAGATWSDVLAARIEALLALLGADAAGGAAAPPISGVFAYAEAMSADGVSSGYAVVGILGPAD
jgi:hypothetical protein